MTVASDRPETPLSRSVLVVEDNPDGRETMRLFLEMLGHHVQVAEDGIEGLHKGLAWHPQVALIDLGLPGLDGYQVARGLRTAFGPDVFLIAHTGYGESEARRRSAEAGFDIHLVKPVDVDELSYWLSNGPGSRAS